MTFKTTSPAQDPEDALTLTFEAHGTNSTSDSQTMNGSFEVKNEGRIIVHGGNIENGQFRNNNGGASISLNGTGDNGGFSIQTDCITQGYNLIVLNYDGDQYKFLGTIECSLEEGYAATQSFSPSSSMTGTTTTQDRDNDGDGIPDSSDRCTHNSNQRCFKEAAT